jgi:hypothetical protein
MIKAKPRDGAEYLDASAARRYLGLSKDMFYALVAEFRRTAGRSGLGPALYFSERVVKWFRPDLDRCAHRFARLEPCQAAQLLNGGRRKQNSKRGKR